MGFGATLRTMFSRAPEQAVVPAEPEPRAVFAFTDPSLPADVLVNYRLMKLGKVDRRRALSVPAVKRGRDLICSVATLPLVAKDLSNREVPIPLLVQHDENVPNVVARSQVLEDLLFDAVSWWRVTAWDDFNRPAKVTRYDPRDVSLHPPDGYQKGYLPSELPTEGVVWMEGHPVSKRAVIAFHSPNPGILDVGAAAIARAIALEEVADLLAASPKMRGFFAPQDGVDPGSDEEVQEMLTDWQGYRAKRLDGYVPAALKYTPIQDPTPTEMQLVEMQRRSDLNLANMLGVDPEDLGISTTSRTYQNAIDRRIDRINTTLAPYMDAITDRLNMPDVTRSGLTVQFKLDEYLRADPRTRAEVAQIQKNMGALTVAEYRQDEGKTPLTPAEAESLETPEPRRVPSSVGEQLSIEPQHQFARETICFDVMATSAAFAVDTESRTITGLAVPWNQVAKSRGKAYRFAKGSVKWSAVNRVKLLRDHVNTAALGKATALTVTDEGLVATFKVSAGQAGDDALALAADEVLDGLSIGVDFRDEDTTPDPQNPGALLVTSAALREISLTAVPAFDDSRLTSVKASDEKESGMPEEEKVAPTPEPAAPVTFTAEQFKEFMATLGPKTAEKVEDRPTVDPAALKPTTAQVVESHPYKFAYEGGRTVFKASEHDFSTDLYQVLKEKEMGWGGDPSAHKRLNSWVKEAFAAQADASADKAEHTFAVTRADTTDKTTPNRYRPDMYQAQLEYPTPLWDMLNAGTTDETKFDIPKYSSSSGLVGAATAGTEPAAGAAALTLQTITPTQVWGKVEVYRQAWRVGGSPQLSGILWGIMMQEYVEDREAAAATFLNTLTAATDIALTGVDASPSNDEYQLNVAQLEAAIADLQFQRGGRRIRSFAVHQALYRVLAAVQDDQGRPLYPIINPTNSNGESVAGYNYIDIAGVRAVPAYGLGSAGGNGSVNSWLFDSTKVLGWADAPEQLFWNFGSTVQSTDNLPQLSMVTVGIYGNVAFGNVDIAGVRQVTYDQNTAA